MFLSRENATSEVLEGDGFCDMGFRDLRHEFEKNFSPITEIRSNGLILDVADDKGEAYQVRSATHIVSPRT